MPRTLPLALVVSAFLAVLAAAPATAQIQNLRGPAKSRAADAAPSDQDCRRIALTFEDAVRYLDMESAQSVFDVEALLERANHGIPTTDSVRETFQLGARAGLLGESGILPGVFATVQAGGNLRYLRLGDRDGARSAVFRLVHADGSAPEYVELLIAATSGGAPRAVDLWTSAEGIAHSRTLRRWLLALVADAGRKLPSRIAGEDRLFATHARTLERVSDAFAQGRNADALAAWLELPDALRRDSSLVLWRLRAALAAGPEAFATAIAEARRARPRDASVELLAVDAALLWNRPEEALKAIAAAEDALGGDPYLRSQRGAVLRGMGQLDRAREECRRALELEPNLEDAHWTLLAISVLQQKHEETLALLTRMSERFEIDWTGMRTSSAFAAFLDSPQGARWRTRVAGAR